MPVDVEETRLPGIGSKFTLRLDAGGRLAVILHDDDEARQLGAVVGGAYERPKIVEDLEMALGELQIEWIPVPDDSPWIGNTLAECGFRAKTGITVIAILRQPEPVTGAQPGDSIERGDTLVTVGKAGQYPAFRRLLSAGEPGSSAKESSAAGE